MWFYMFSRLVVRPVLRVYLRLSVVGDPASERGPVLIAANHSSFLDPCLIGVVFPRPIRYLITTKWYYRGPLWTALFKAFGGIPVRDGDPRRAVDTVCGYLDRGVAIGVFPEGHVAEDGKLQRFRSGLARIAARSGVPVVPVGIRGAFESFPRHRRFPRPTPVSLHIGEPLRFDGSPIDREPSRAEIRAFNEVLFRKIAVLAGAPVDERREDSSSQRRKSG